MDFYCERIDKIISSTGIMSRKDAKKAAKFNRICLNGVSIKDCSVKVTNNDILTLDGNVITYKKYVYFMLNKPKGYVCSTDDPSSPIVIELLPNELQRQNLFSVGRLDKNTTGLLLLTNDGAFAHNLISPSKHVSKVYHVCTKLPIENHYCDVFAKGAVLDNGYICLPAELKILGDNEAIVTVHEGKYHQIKRMFESVGNKVTDLHRISIGGVSLDNRLKPGDFRSLTDNELSLFGA